VFLPTHSAIALEYSAPLLETRWRGSSRRLDLQLCARRGRRGLASSVLNREEEIAAEEVADFCMSLDRFVPDLWVIFPWLSVSRKLHALTHHALTLLRRFGSLGSYAEQTFET